MYRVSKISKPVSNPREHVQRNAYVRNTLQRRRLFSSRRFWMFSKAAIAFYVIAIFFFWRTMFGNISYKSVGSNRVVEPSYIVSNHQNANIVDTPANTVIDSKSKPFDDFKCSFREYKPHRYYPLDDLSEKFLSDAEYIRGKLPFIINPRSKDVVGGDMPKKICVDTSEWESVEEGYRPFSDGQNPSFVSLAHNVFSANDENGSDSKVDSTVNSLVELYGSEEMKNMYLGLLLFGDSQCRWDMSEEELKKSKFSPLQKPPEKRSMVIILNESFDPIGRAVLQLERDAVWGTKRKKYGKQRTSDGNGFERSIVELDDARLFFHEGKLHVLYRNGPSFGYESECVCL